MSGFRAEILCSITGRQPAALSKLSAVGSMTSVAPSHGKEQEMASDQSGEALTAGDPNFANHPTVIAGRTFEQKTKFDGEVILIVRPDVVPRERPLNKVDGVHT